MKPPLKPLVSSWPMSKCQWSDHYLDSIRVNVVWIIRLDFKTFLLLVLLRTSFYNEMSVLTFNDHDSILCLTRNKHDHNLIQICVTAVHSVQNMDFGRPNNTLTKPFKVNWTYLFWYTFLNSSCKQILFNFVLTYISRSIKQGF